MSTRVEAGEEFIAHFGVKGMRWGVRKERAVTTEVRTDQGLIKRQTKVQTKGGESHPATNDAIKAAVQKQKLKKSGAAALSNQELRELANRLQLEQQVGVLTSSKGKKFVTQELETETKKGLKKGAGVAAPVALKKAKKGAATVAVAALI